MVKTEEADAANAVDEGPEVPAVTVDGSRVTAEVQDDVLVVRVYPGKPGRAVTVWVDDRPVPVGPAQKPRGRHHRTETLDLSQEQG